MTEQTYTTVDKAGWGPGEWQTEPDKIVWIDPATGLDCMVKRSPVMGNLCGYVGVPPGHPWHGMDYSDVPVEVHGTLTYGDECVGSEAEGICHVPAPGRPHDVWWLGFDCGHFMDVSPAMDARQAALGIGCGGDRSPGVSYKPVAYVREEVESLARQCAEAA